MLNRCSGRIDILPEGVKGCPVPEVVTVEQKREEAHTFGPAAVLVNEWRRFPAGRKQAASRVDQARVAMPWWDMEAGTLGEFS